MSWAIERGELLDVLRGFADDSFDALACDPPYGFRFMGKTWDYTVPSVQEWGECLRVLKPGAPLVAFGGSRTYHRLACKVEDAGFELRDQLMWLYAKGFPKSQNIALAVDKAAGAERKVIGTRTLTGNAAISTKEKGGTFGVQVGSIPPKEVNVTAPATELAQLWDGYGTALKPGHEPIVLARKRLDGTMAENVARWGVGGLAIDACRIGEHDCTPEQFAAKASTRTAPNTYGEHKSGGSKMPTRVINRWKDGAKPFGGGAGHEYESVEVSAGRWPANLLFDEDAAAIFDAEVGPRKSGLAVRENGGGGQIMSGIGDQPYKPKPSLPNIGYMDGKTNPSRFFFCSKVATKEREAGCDALPKRSAGEVTDREDDTDGLNSPRAGAGRTGGARNHHPTLKPISLTTWLCRLIMPPKPGVILVPFAGAGSEMIGALKAGWPHVFGIERDPEYVKIAQARLAHWCPEVEAA